MRWFSNTNYSATVKEDPDMDDHITLFFYLYPHNCIEIIKYIKFIYKWHPFYKWQAPDFTIRLIKDDKELIFNPFTKVNLVTGQKLLFGLIEFDDNKHY